MALLNARVAEGRDDGHADLELLQLGLNGGRGPHGSLVVGVGEHLGQLVGCSPQVLNLTWQTQHSAYHGPLFFSPRNE